MTKYQIPRRMVKEWCKVDGEPGYLLTNGVKIKQSIVEFVDIQCPKCKKIFSDKKESKRQEAYIKRFNVCLMCHSKELFPNDADKANRYRLTMGCTASVGAHGLHYNVDYMLRKCEQIND